MSIEITNWIMNGIAGVDTTVVELCVLETVKEQDGSETQDVYNFTVTGKHATTAYIFEHLQELVDAYKEQLEQASLTPDVQLAELRDAVNRTINLAAVPDATALDAMALFETWSTDKTYIKGERRRWHGKLYRVLKDHTSHAGWEPDKVPSLFELVTAKPKIPAWKRPSGDDPEYKRGDKVTHNGYTWVSTRDDNRFEPGTFGWDKVDE